MALGWGEEEEVSWGEHQRWVRRTFSPSPSQSLLPSPPPSSGTPFCSLTTPSFFYLAPIPPLFFTLFIFPILPTSETSIPPSHKGFGGRRAEAGSDERTSLPLSLPLSLSQCFRQRDAHDLQCVKLSGAPTPLQRFFCLPPPPFFIFFHTLTHKTSCPSPHLLQAVVFTLSYILYKPSPSDASSSSPFPASICLSISRGFLVVCVCVCVSGRRRMNTPMKEKGGRRGLYGTAHTGFFLHTRKMGCKGET